MSERSGDEDTDQDIALLDWCEDFLGFGASFPDERLLAAANVFLGTAQPAAFNAGGMARATRQELEPAVWLEIVPKLAHRRMILKTTDDMLRAGPLFPREPTMEQRFVIDQYLKWRAVRPVEEQGVADFWHWRKGHVEETRAGLVAWQTELKRRVLATRQAPATVDPIFTFEGETMWLRRGTYEGGAIAALVLDADDSIRATISVNPGIRGIGLGKSNGLPAGAFFLKPYAESDKLVQSLIKERMIRVVSPPIKARSGFATVYAYEIVDS